MDKIRAKFKELLENSKDWDEKHDPTLEVVETDEQDIKLWALCSAKDSSTAWTLECELREQLVAYIGQMEQGLYLSRHRLQVENGMKKEEVGRNGRS